MIPAQIQRRLKAVEDKHRRISGDRRTKAERDAMIREVLSDPERVREISARLLGCKPADISDAVHARHMAVLQAAVRADT
ncbi:hypothetical protein [Enterovirga sp. CN4-39]|uniref:hypothetical protein n=1 Tax=Enterovirga sp. CN4-39 TaxID=3400910 RepID=UPI003BFEFB7B